MNFDAILAIWRRQLGSLLLNPLGYVFILVFVLVSAAIMFWKDDFFSRNIADLDPLLEFMPWLLIVLLPALAMGSWASERELGTEEQLLTLPLSVGDALLGKWLGVASYFTLAMLFSFSNVFVIKSLGSPDTGLLVANYIGWWLAGLVFAALSVLASSLVSLPSIGFVLGVLFCAGVMGIAWSAEWFDPFNRGLVPMGGLVTAGVFIGLSLGAASLLLSMRRWHEARYASLACQCVVFVGLGVTFFNLGVQADRRAIDKDITDERLSSLSSASAKVLSEITTPVKIIAFISQKLPPELELKGKEVSNTLKVIERSLGNKVELEWHFPADPLDEEGTLGTQFYGLAPKRVVIEEVTGKQETDVFLGVVVNCGARSEKINHFDPGLSVEYELVRAVRTASTPKKKVLGIVKTDLSMMGGFDFQTRQSSPEWQVVREWKRQYDVREVFLESPVGEDIHVLVAAQPSRLNDTSLKNLHDYIWAGRPILVMEDPMPMFSGPQLGTSQPKKPANPMMGQPPEEKGDLTPILRGLGLDASADQILWSDYNPSHAFRKLLWPSFVWCYQNQGSIQSAPSTVGIQSVVLPFPGTLRAAPDKPEDLKIKQLILPATELSWGTNSYTEYFENHPFFGPQRKKPKLFNPSPKDMNAPALAVEISGKMKRSYPLAKLEEPMGTNPQAGLGQLSEKPVHVIWVADTDFAHDQFFDFYRNEDNRFGRDEMRFLQDLRNVQFIANILDALVGDVALLDLRTRLARRRPLDKLEVVLSDTQNKLREAETSAQKDNDEKIEHLRNEVNARLDKIKQREDLDEVTKRQEVAKLEKVANRQLEKDSADVTAQSDVKVRKAQADQKRAFSKEISKVRYSALGIPAAILFLLALIVLVFRVSGEQRHVPESRKRT